MHARAAQLLGRHGLVGHRLHHVGAGDEHVARVLHHEDEVGHGRRIDVAARARPHDHGDLRDDARGQHVAQEHLAVAAERRHALLDARAAGVEQADDGRAVLQRHVLDLGDLLGVRLRQRAAEHREVLGEHVDDAAVDGAPAGDHAVAGDLGLLHAEVVAAVLDVHVELLEGVLVHQQLDALARGELAALVLGVDARLPAAEPRLRPPPLQLVQHFLHGSRPTPWLVAPYRLIAWRGALRNGVIAVPATVLHRRVTRKTLRTIGPSSPACGSPPASRPSGARGAPGPRRPRPTC